MSVDTPDYQRGVVSAQQLLADVPAGTGSVAVTLPPNIETLVIVPAPGEVISDVQVVGQQTGVPYTVVDMRLKGTGQLLTGYYADVSNTVDRTVAVSLASQPLGGFRVYSDTGVHLVADVSALRDTFGVRQVSVVAPSTVSGDHPPVELQQVANVINSSTAPTIVSAPPAGQRIRLFGVNAGAAQTWLALGPFGVGPWFVCTANTTLAVQLLPSGVPLPAATAFEITNAGAAGTTGIAGATYTIESA